VFLHVVRDLPRFRGDETMQRAWVFGIARHRLADERRRSARRPRVTTTAVPDVSSPPPDSFDPELSAALGRLTADQREVVVLRFVADLPLGSVAAMTRRSVGAVKALQHRALEVLAGELRPE
jgi:RNA polymerase sigma-70 factor (ECF subfamily)